MASVTLMWEHDGVGVQYFIVARRNAGIGNHLALTMPGIVLATARSYVDTTVETGKQYDYRVTAVHATNGLSAPADLNNVNVPLTPPNPPTNLTAQVNVP